MGKHIHAVCQRKVDGKWRHMLNVPCSPVRVDWMHYIHYDFLIYSGFVLGDGSVEYYENEDNYAISRARGLPEDFDGDQWCSVNFFDPISMSKEIDVDLPDSDCGGTWLTIDELVEHDYDRIVTRYNETKPLREFLGEKFIQFWVDAKRLGAERIVLTIE